ncbi:hypothetical protein D3C72_2113310 [compost metagenome]
MRQRSGAHLYLAHVLGPFFLGLLQFVLGLAVCGQVQLKPVQAVAKLKVKLGAVFLVVDQQRLVHGAFCDQQGPVVQVFLQQLFFQAIALV